LNGKRPGFLGLFGKTTARNKNNNGWGLKPSGNNNNKKGPGKGVGAGGMNNLLELLQDLHLVSIN